MTATHTPGPWEHRGTDGGAEVICHREAAGKRRTLAHVYQESRHGRQEANARLIAAAPDLLAACIEAREALFNLSRHAKDADCFSPGHDDEHVCTTCTLKMAIAKATEGGDR